MRLEPHRALEALSRLTKHHQPVVAGQQFNVHPSGGAGLRNALNKSERSRQVLDRARRVLVQKNGVSTSEILLAHPR